MIYTVTLNPAVDKTMIVPGFSAGAVNRVSQIIMDPGGKGINVSKSIQALGGKSVCLGILGGDTGRYILAALEEMGLKHAMVMSADQTRTNIKIADPLLGSNTDINEPGAPVSMELLTQVEQKLLTLTKPGDTVVLAGKNPPGTPEELLAKWVSILNNTGVRVCLDTVGTPMQLALRERPYLIKPNVEELEEITGEELRTQDEIIMAAKQLVEEGIGVVAVSRGADGAVFVTGNEVICSRVPKVEAVSTVGAGDSMMAALAYYMESGCTMVDLARRATAVATATVLIEGSKPAPLAAVNAMLERIAIETY